MRRTRVALAAAVAVLVVVGAGWWLSRDGGGPGPDHDPVPSPSSTSTPTPTPVVRAYRIGDAPVLRPAPPPLSLCTPRARGAFRPVAISVPGVTTSATVLALGRDADDVPGVPPLSSSGKVAFAWDAPGIAPGEPQGNVLLNAHTWPDGSATGNRLLAGLDVGDRFALQSSDGSRLCYRVTERTEVPFDTPGGRVYDTEGPPQAVIIVCSGVRTGPGHWTHRTLWFAGPVAP
jgi:hypothetical protein